jgi:FADH2 O2-dependent halogenase
MVYDLAIVGSGMGGSLLALAARRQGLSVLLIERGSHPRFSIGESTSPLMNLLLEEFAYRYDLPRLLPLARWGSWKAAYPELGVGKKRGFSYYAQPFDNKPDRSDQLLVAASPGDACADTHWLRADVDHWLVKEAIALGAEYVERTSIERVDVEEGHWRLAHSLSLPRSASLSPPLGVLPSSTAQEGDIHARFLVDASGPQGFLHRRNDWRDVGFSGYPETCALYSHFHGVQHFSPSLAPSKTGVRRGKGPGDGCPYPPDWAALHHVFDGGWMWVLRFDDERVSAGISVEKWLAEELELHEKEAGWRRFLERFPSVEAQFAEASAIEPWIYSEKLAFRTERAGGVESGAPWALLPSAVGFIDPFYSTGMTLTLLGVGRLAALLKKPSADALAEYERLTLEDLDWTAEFIACHFAHFGDFTRFSALTMYYFAAASYSEMARRLGVPAPRFLAGDDPLFRAGIARCRTDRAGSPEEFAQRIAADIAHKNVAGLADPVKKNWYGVDLEDVFRASSKLGFPESELRRIVTDAIWARCE